MAAHDGQVVIDIATATVVAATAVIVTAAAVIVATVVATAATAAATGERQARHQRDTDGKGEADMDSFPQHAFPHERFLPLSCVRMKHGTRVVPAPPAMLRHLPGKT